MKVFITGDRMVSPVYPVLVAVEMLRAVAQGAKVGTGENGGVEEMVRGFGELAGIEVEVVPGTKPEWDARHQSLAEGEWSVVAVHSDPHASSIISSLIANLPEAELRITTHLDLMV